MYNNILNLYLDRTINISLHLKIKLCHFRQLGIKRLGARTIHFIDESPVFIAEFGKRISVKLYKFRNSHHTSSCDHVD